MPAATLLGVIHDHRDVSDQIVATLVGQIRMPANRASETAGLGARQRMWAEMLRLAGSRRATTGNAILSPPPTHAEQAARIGGHREAVTHELRRRARITESGGERTCLSASWWAQAHHDGVLVSVSLLERSFLRAHNVMERCGLIVLR
jgi:hypothetical protein